MKPLRLTHEAAVTATSAVVATGLAGLSSIVIARGLGVEQRGVWAVVASTATLAATVAALGLPEAAAYGTARRARGTRGRLVAAATAAALVLAVLAALATVVALLLQDGADATRVVAAGAAVAAAAVVAPVVQRLVQIAVGPGAYALVQVATPAIVLAAVLALAAADALTVARVGAASAAAAAVVAVAGLVLLRREGELQVGAWRRPLRSLGLLRPLVGYSLITFATLALTHAVQRLDVLLVNGYRGTRDAGLYAVAVQFADLLLVVPAALGIIAFRRAATAPHGAWADLVRIVRWAAVCGAAAAVALVLLAPWALPLLVGDEYEGAVDAARILAPGIAVLGVQSVLSNYVAGRGRPAAVLVAWGVGAAATLAANLWAIPRHGIEGAAAVSTAGYLLVLALHVVAVRQVRDADRRAG